MLVPVNSIICVNNTHDVLLQFSTIHYKSSFVIPKLGQSHTKLKAQLLPFLAEEALELVYLAWVKLPVIDVVEVFLGKTGLFQHQLQLKVVGLRHIIICVNATYGDEISLSLACCLLVYEEVETGVGLA